MSSEILRAGGLIIFRRLQVGIFEYLLLQTSYGKNHWTPPKGHLDPGEDYRTAAMRETEEEAGYTSDQLRITDFKSTLNYVVKNRRPKEVVYWLAELKDPNAGVKLSNEHQDFKWCDLDEACRLSEFSDMVKVLRDCDKYLKS